MLEQTNQRRLLTGMGLGMRHSLGVFTLSFKRCAAQMLGSSDSGGRLVLNLCLPSQVERYRQTLLCRIPGAHAELGGADQLKVRGR